VPGTDHPLVRRVASMQFWIDSLTSLRRLVDLPPAQDITARQWAVLEPQLAAAAARLSARLKDLAGRYLPAALHHLAAARRLNGGLGRLEGELTRAFVFFDTYMDVLTQRRPVELGAVLSGCDVLAREAMIRKHPALQLIEPPCVCCNRGSGASILRERVPLPDCSPNPMPLIEIPYARLRQKHNLTSILHEAGHQALARLGLVEELPQTLRTALRRTGAPEPVRDLCALWALEIGPDFWAFCLVGAAEAAALIDLFALDPMSTLRIAVPDPHPPPYLRTLLAIEWCRIAWGRGPWDRWAIEWRSLYPLTGMPPANRAMLLQARRYLPVVARALFSERLAGLGGRTLPDLFDLADIAPARLARLAATANRGRLELHGLSACTQLAVFGTLRRRGRLSEPAFDRLMTAWLIRLGARRHDIT
jgi:hypothetical protein